MTHFALLLLLVNGAGFRDQLGRSSFTTPRQTAVDPASLRAAFGSSMPEGVTFNKTATFAGGGGLQMSTNATLTIPNFGNHLTSTEGCFRVCITPPWTSPTGYIYMGNHGNGALMYVTDDGFVRSFHGGMDNPALGYTFVNGAQRCVENRWSATLNRREVWAITPNTNDFRDFSVYPFGAFTGDATIHSDGGQVYTLNSVTLGKTWDACGAFP